MPSTQNTGPHKSQNKLPMGVSSSGTWEYRKSVNGLIRQKNSNSVLVWNRLFSCYNDSLKILFLRKGFNKCYLIDFYCSKSEVCF